jgi:hypothetical protein
MAVLCQHAEDTIVQGPRPWPGRPAWYRVRALFMPKLQGHASDRDGGF